MTSAEGTASGPSGRTSGRIAAGCAKGYGTRAMLVRAL